MTHSVRAGAAIAVLAILASACSSGPRYPAKATLTENGTLTPSGSGSPGAGSRFKTGIAHLEITGEVTKSLTLQLAQSNTAWTAPPGGMSLFFSDPKRDSAGIGGTSETGTRKTSSVMTFAFTYAAGGSFLLGISTKGECVIDVTRSDPTGVDATVDCKNLVISKKTVNIHATMSARP